MLHYIAEEGCVDILSWLLGKSSFHMNVNSVDFHGFTPLHLAIQNGHTGVVELLQLHNIDSNVGAVNASHLDQPMIIQGINCTGKALDEAHLRILEPNIGANVSPDIPMEALKSMSALLAGPSHLSSIILICVGQIFFQKHLQSYLVAASHRYILLPWEGQMDICVSTSEVGRDQCFCLGHKRIFTT